MRRSEAAAPVAAALRDWLLSEACRSPAGAFCAWRDAETGRLAFEYPEISGYALTYAAALDDPGDAEVESAARAAEWLVRRLRAGDRSARADWDSGAIYVFDLAMVASGLVSFGRRYGGGYQIAGLRIVELLLREAEVIGRIPAVAPGPRTAHAGWATQGRAHLLKVVQCLLLAGEDAAAAALIEEADALQRDDGRFVTETGSATTMLHPHCYALEGLWIWGVAQEDEDALDRARRGLAWAFAHQLPDGGLPRYVLAGGEPGPEQSDATAQAVRLACLLDERTPAVERAAERLEALGRSGALPYRPAALPVHENVWATLFAAQALELTHGERAGLRWSELV
ncbi:MAG TPA: hypothetical protein VF186_04035 [Gaiellaceae bacterium]